jgi:ankyrin repeat protein
MCDKSNLKPVTWKGHDGATPLHAACENSHPQIVEKLIKKGANITVTSVESLYTDYIIQCHGSFQYSDAHDRTPLHAATSGVKSEGTVETVSYLLKHGAMEVLNNQSKEEERVTNDLTSIIIIMHSIYYYTQKTPLSTACFYGHHETVKLLLDKGAIVDASCMKYAVEKDFK